METNRFAGIFRLLIALSIVALLAGCSGGGGGGDETPAPGPNPELTYDLSGTVTSGGVALPGVTITLSGTSSGTKTTDASGNYSFTELANGSYTITPTLAGYVFNQVSQMVTVNGSDPAAINFTATANSGTTYSISGSVTSGGVSLSGVTMTLSGTSSGIATTLANGNYCFTNLKNGLYTATPTFAGYVFNPVSQVVTINGDNVTAINFTATANSGTTYSISGTVTNGGVALSSVTITLSGTSSGSTSTNSSGSYSFTGLANGSYTITPSLSGYEFTPANPTVTVNNANASASFIAIANSTPTYNITGTITKSGGGVLQGVTITLIGTSSGIKTTDASGNYSFTGLANGSYIITPTISGYVFDPVTRVVTVSNSNATANFNATVNSSPTYTISGTITKSTGGTLQGATISLSGGSSRTATTNLSGGYSFTGLANGSYTITPTLSGYTFNPVNRTVTVSGADVQSISFTATSSSNPPVDPPVPPPGQPSLTKDQVQDALYAVYGGIGYNDRMNTADDALLYRIMVSNMNSIGIDLILKTVTGDPNYFTKLWGLLTSPLPVEFKSVNAGYTSAITINRDPQMNGFFPFTASLTVAFNGTGYNYGTGLVYGTGNNTDLTANFTGHFTLSPSLAIIIRNVKATFGNGVWTVEGGVTTSYNDWKLAYYINYGADDPMGGPGEPTNLEFISKYNTISDPKKTYPDLRDYTIGGSFTINGKPFSFVDGFMYQQEQIDTYVMMSANGQMSVPGLASKFLVSSTLNTINPETNYTIITHVYERGAWSSDWRSGTLILGDTSAVFDNGSVTFTGGAGSWTVPDWKTALSIP